MSDDSSQRIEFLADLARVVDGDPEALDKHAELLRQNEAVRELRQEALQLAERIAEAGADFHNDAELSDRALRAVEARGGATQLDRRQSQPSSRTRARNGEAMTKNSIKAQPKTDRPKPRGRVGLLVGLLVLVAAGGGAAYFTGLIPGVGPAPANIPKKAAPAESAIKSRLGGRVTQLSTANADGSGLGRLRGKQTQTLALEGEIGPGDALQTDAYTRAGVTLSDGTTIVLNHDSELRIETERDRSLVLARGEMLADVAPADGAPLVIATPTARVVIKGTKLAVSVGDEQTSVRVTRGEVRLEAAGGKGASPVLAGQEGVVAKGGAPSVVPMMAMSSAVRWAELEPEGEEPQLSGLGELRASVPGEREQEERPLSLAKHAVSVRIAGNVARTEIEETFRNDGDRELEGIYRFPLPPAARIDSLSLLVDGEWHHAAFVERDRGRKIWKGVIKNAEKKQQKRVEDEYIWVPGPWRDPALLEWQQGGRFELRIFPIPAQGERSIRLAYTELLAPHADGRRYVYPLSHAASPELRVGRFEIEASVQGAAPGAVKVHGYPLEPAQGEADKPVLRYASDGFLAAGDLTLDIPTTDASELQYWSYRGEATVPPGRAAAGQNPELAREQTRLHGDRRGYVAFALRPQLPAFTEGKRQHHLLLLDASQSMFGERYARARALVERMIAEMDRRDTFELLACDATCTAMDGGASAPSSQVAAQAAAWLGGLRPAGASDIEAALRSAGERLAADSSRPEHVHVIYVGDGQASIGARSPSALAAEARALTAEGGRRLSTVGIGSDADALTLRALARAGRGHYLPYLPGRSVVETALDVLETGYGVSLADAKLIVPEGLSDVSPSELSTIRAGEEILVTARVDSPRIEGELVLSGSVGGQGFENRYPVSLTPSEAEGNRFVPALWAAQQIDEAQQHDDPTATLRTMALSTAYGVISRHTSLLVLESEAMSDAFGVDRGIERPTWTGEEEAETSQSDGLVDVDALSDGAERSVASSGAADTKAGGALRMRRAPAPAKAKSAEADLGTAAPAAPLAEAEAASAEDREAEAEPLARRSAEIAQRRPGGRWMKQQWVRVATIEEGVPVSEKARRAVDDAVRELEQNPDSRDRHRAVVRALSVLGNLERALDAVEGWVARDSLDPEALTYLADIVGRQGNRALAMRILSGIVDLQPDNRVLHGRLARAFERAELWERACAHRRTLAGIGEPDADAATDAVRCLQRLGRDDDAERLVASLGEALRAKVEQRANSPSTPENVAGDLMIDASWQGERDLDITLVTNQGTRVSWLGGRVNVVGDGGMSAGRERLGLKRASAGSYVVEVTPTSRDAADAVEGQLSIEVLGQRKKIPFTLRGDRLRVARINVQRERRLVAP